MLVRVDFNVPVVGGQITDDSRIQSSLPTLRYLVEHHARVILLTHFGRPGGFVVEELRTNILAERVSQLMDMPVSKINNCIGPEVQDAANHLEPGQILFLENVRFHPGELVNDDHFAAKLAANADLYVNDAFGVAHRIHASIISVPRHLPAVAGLLMESELLGLRKVYQKIRQPVTSLLGGGQLADKGRFIASQIEFGNRVLLGGQLANTFLRAKGLEMGHAHAENNVLILAKELIAKAHNLIELPQDLVVADSLSPGAKKKVVPSNKVPDWAYIIDIGPETVQHYLKVIEHSNTLIWNGPLGAIEFPALAQSTEAIAKKRTDLPQLVKIAGGGNTLAALDRAGLAGKIDYISTGGVSFLTALESKPLPGVAVLQDKPDTVPRVDQPKTA